LILSRSKGKSVLVAGRTRVTVEALPPRGGVVLRIVGPGRDEQAVIGEQRGVWVEGLDVRHVRTRQGKALLSFDGPRDVSVTRTELLTEAT